MIREGLKVGYYRFVDNKNGRRMSPLILDARVYRPDSPGAHPAVVLSHGLMSHKGDHHIDRLGEDLATNGIVAVTFDGPGIGKSEGKIGSDYRLSTHVDALRSVLIYAKQRSYVDSGRIGLFGHSVGGNVALMGAAEPPVPVKAVAVVSTSVDVEPEPGFQLGLKVYKNGATEVNGNGISFTPEQLEEFRLEFGEPQHDMTRVIAFVDAPLLVVWGENDRHIAPESTQRLATLSASSRIVRVGIQGMRHFYHKQQASIEAVNRSVVAFFKEEL